jgi:hypothetical protein
MQAAVRLHSKEIIELITTFIPAPGIDILQEERLPGLVGPGRWEIGPNLRVESRHPKRRANAGAITDE